MNEDDLITLMPVNPDNWRLGLRVKPEQERFVANSTAILARAYAYRYNNSHAFVIYHNTTPIGMALYYDDDEVNAYVFSQFFIDQNYQGLGYGERAAKTVIQLMLADDKYNKVLLCYIEGDIPAKNLYEKLGFVHTGERDEDEIMMELKLR